MNRRSSSAIPAIHTVDNHLNGWVWARTAPNGGQSGPGPHQTESPPKRPGPFQGDLSVFWLAQGCSSLGSAVDEHPRATPEPLQLSDLITPNVLVEISEKINLFPCVCFETECFHYWGGGAPSKKPLYRVEPGNGDFATKDLCCFAK